MFEPSSSPAGAILRATRMALLRREFCIGCCVAGLGLGLFLVAAGAVRLGMGLRPFPFWMLGGGGLAWLVGTAIWTGLRRPDWPSAARFLDERVPAAAERFTTWLQLSGPDQNGAWNETARREIDRFAVGIAKPVSGPSFPVRWMPVGIAVLVLAAVGIELVFRMQLSSSSAERSLMAGLLESAAKDAATEPELSDLVESLHQEAAKLRDSPIAAPRENAIRSLAGAAAKVRSQAADAAGGNESELGNPNSGEQTRNSGANASPQVTVNAAIGNPPPGLDPAAAAAMRQRLDRMAQRMEERKREAAGLGSKRQNEESGTPGKGDESLLAELAKPGASSAPGETDSGLPFGGPGSDQDRGSGGLSPPVEAVSETSGPDLLVAATPGDSQNATSFSVVSSESEADAAVPKRGSPAVPLEFTERSLTPEDIPLGARDMVRRYFESLNAAE